MKHARAVPLRKKNTWKFTLDLLWLHLIHLLSDYNIFMAINCNHKLYKHHGCIKCIIFHHLSTKIIWFSHKQNHLSGINAIQYNISWTTKRNSPLPALGNKHELQACGFEYEFEELSGSSYIPSISQSGSHWRIVYYAITYR